MKATSLDVAVVGAGIGGLCAAIELASQGHSVKVFDALPHVGGKAATKQVGDLVFDTGPSLLTLSHVFEGLFSRAGASFQERVALVQTTPAFDYLFPDGVRLQTHHALEDTLASVESSLGARAANELGGFLDYARGIWEAAAPAFVFGAAPNALNVAKLDMATLFSLRSIDPMRSMKRAIDSRVSDPHLRTMLYRFATYNGSDVRVAPATLNCIAWVELGLGGWGVKGGIGALVSALESLAREKGAEFHLGVPVTRVLYGDGRRVCGVRLEDEREWAVDAAVVNADVAAFPRLLDLPSTRKDVPSMSAYTAVFDLESAEKLAPHTVIFPENYLAEFEDIFDRKAPPSSPTVYLCNQSATHTLPSGAPLFAMTNAPALPSGSSEWTAGDYREKVERALSSRLGVLPKRVWERLPTDLERSFPLTGGAIYGPSSNGTFAAFRRMPNRVPSFQGLYAASGSTHPGGGMPLCAQAGAQAARELMEDFG